MRRIFAIFAAKCAENVYLRTTKLAQPDLGQAKPIGPTSRCALSARATHWPHASTRLFSSRRSYVADAHPRSYEKQRDRRRSLGSQSGSFVIGKETRY